MTKTPTGILVLVPLELRNEIKKRAINKNVTMKAWILQAVLQQIALEKKYE